MNIITPMTSFIAVAVSSLLLSTAHAAPVRDSNQAVTLCKSHITELGMERFKLKRVKKSSDNFSVAISTKNAGEREKGVCTVNRISAEVEYAKI